MAETRQGLLKLLADGEFHSGEALGQALGISRTGIWKHIDSLESLGLDIFRVHGRGYRLSRPLELLAADSIRAQIDAEVLSRIDVLAVEQQIDSTNAELLRSTPAPDAIEVCVAEYQSAGRGRRGRRWESPFGSNVYLSISWPFSQLPPDFAALSLAMGVGARRALSDCGVENVQLKWPNDIYLEEKKLGGILLEMRGEPPGACRLVAGIGINVSMPEETDIPIDQAWTDLSRAGRDVSRNRLVAALIMRWVAVLDEFARFGFDHFVSEWRAADLLAGQAVRVIDRDQQWEGDAIGVAKDGALEIEVGGEVRRVIVGDVSLRRVST